ncbi:hypothetical protein RBH29_13340 [Herbivorax sp. ANBcel31]|uniref:hypothetical protein n=1 Tax=Herbivorax sp. ANBcel31 TaxID=3069754 RepID=UPI0027B0D8FD|nr:hypothetical protein [Herbivorax sp. ANBcel31]MDQ2087410.1 hypothetical protein [Herbivorax sp. ANBcel31]
MSFSSNKRAEIIWIDDIFGQEAMSKRLDEGIDFWNEMFQAPEKIYRLFDIKIKLITNYEDAIAYIKNIKLNRSTYHYFIVDLTLPKNKKKLEEGNCVPTYGKKIGKLLQEKEFDFSFLTSSSDLGALRTDEKDLLLADFNIKDYHNDLSLPESLKNKMLIKLQNNISWINLKYNFFNKITDDSTINNNKEEEFEYFPYIDKYKDFVNMSEFNQINLNEPVFLKSHRDNSNSFEQQSVLLLLSETFFNCCSKGMQIQYYNFQIIDDDKAELKYNTFTAQLYGKKKEDILWVIKTRNLPQSVFKKLQNSLRKSKVIFIVSDDEYEKYLELIDGRYSVYDLPFFKPEDYYYKKNLFDHILNLKISQKLFDENKNTFSLYQEHPELILDIHAYMALSDPSFGVSKLSDSYEMFEWVTKVFSHFNQSIIDNIVNNKPTMYENLLGKDIIETLDEKEVISIKEKSVEYWLKVSWGFPHGVQVDRYIDNPMLINLWEMNTIKILSNLLEAIEATDNSTLIGLKEIFNNSYISAIINETDRSKLKEANTLVKWPHRQYPMPAIFHKKFEEDNKHLWINHDKLDYVNYSKKMYLYYCQLEMYLDYYDRILVFIMETYKYLPKITHPFIKMVFEDISKKELSPSNSEFKEALKKYIFGMLAISSVFSEIIINQSEESDTNIGYFSSDEASDLASYNKKFNLLLDVFKNTTVYDINTDEFIKDKQYTGNYSKNYLQEINQLSLTNTSSMAKDLIRVIELEEHDEQPLSVETFIKRIARLNMQRKDNKYIQKPKDELGLSDYEQSIYTALLDTKFKQYFKWVDLFNYFDFPFNIIKYMDTTLHFKLMINTRNKALEHNLVNINNDLLYESFIFTYESLWLQYQHIIAGINPQDEVLKHKTQFVKFDGEVKPKNLKFNTETIKSRKDFVDKVDGFYSVKKKN